MTGHLVSQLPWQSSRTRHGPDEDCMEFLRLDLRHTVNGMVRRRPLEVVECGGKEAFHETTRARH